MTSNPSFAFSLLILYSIIAFVVYLILKNNNKSQNSSVENSKKPYGYLNLLSHTLLLMFTFDIWQYIWIYKTTDKLNNLANEEYRSPTTKLLLCMFIPFYYIYWTYKTAKIVDNLAKDKGIQSDITPICLVLSFFIEIVPPIIIQDKINNIVTQ